MGQDKYKKSRIIDPGGSSSSWQMLLWRFWEALRRWFHTATFVPSWLTEKWRTPVIGYSVACLSQFITVSITLLLMRLFYSFAFPGMLPILAILLVALFWGTGPSLFATLLGTVLITFAVLQPTLGWMPETPQHLVETGIFLLVGAAIGLLASRTEIARIEAEGARRHLQSIFMQAPSHIVVLRGPEHRLELINPPGRKNANREQLIGHTLREVLPDGEQEGLISLLDRVYTTNTPYRANELPATILQSDGHEKKQYFNVVYQPSHDTYGNVDGIVVYSVDVTEQVLARQQIEELVRQLKMEKEALTYAQQMAAEHASRMEAIFEAMADGVAVYDAQGVLLQANSAMRDLFSLESSNGGPVLLQEHLERLDLRHSDGRPVERDELPQQRILRGETLKGRQTVDIQTQTHDGRALYLNISGAPICGGNNTIIGGVLICRDVTTRRLLQQRTQRALEALLRIAEALVDVSSTSSIVAEHEDKQYAVAKYLVGLIRDVLDCERVSLTTIEPETGVLQSVAAVGIPPQLEEQWRARRSGFNLGEQVHDIALGERLRMSEVVVLDMSKPPFNERPNPFNIHTFMLAPLVINKQLHGILSIDHAGEDHIYSQSERTLARAIARLTALVIERERLLAQRAEALANEVALRETNRLMDDFIGIAGHELRTPLTTIKASVQLAKRQLIRMLKQELELQEEAVHYITNVQGFLDRAERQVDMQNRLVNDLLDISRIQADRLELHPELFDLCASIQETVNDYRALSPERELKLTIEHAGEALVLADADRIRQVITNYLSNALKYSEASKAVEVGITQVDEMVRVYVRDQGPGLSIKEQQLIWDRFYRVRGVEVKSGSGVGLGLGLHICRTIIERQRGRVGVESQVGQGSTFWFMLPLAETSTTHELTVD